MGTTLIHSADFTEGYRITRAGDSLFIQAKAGCKGPLRLSDRQLAPFGVVLAVERRVSCGAGLEDDRRLAEERQRQRMLALIMALAILLLVLVTVPAL